MNEQLNFQLFSLIDASSHTNPILVQVAIWIANGLFYSLVAFLIFYWLVGNDNQKKLVLKSTCISLIALGIAQIITHIYPHPRPFMIGMGHTLISHSADASFPSDHMTVFSSVAMGFLLSKKYIIGSVIFAFGCLVAWARVFLGIHFPFDMFGAVILAVITALVFVPIWRQWGETFSQPVIKMYQVMLFQSKISAKSVEMR